MTIYLDSHPITIASIFAPVVQPSHAWFNLKSYSLSTCHTSPDNCRVCPFAYDCSIGTLKPRILSHLHTNYPELFL